MRDKTKTKRIHELTGTFAKGARLTITSIMSEYGVDRRTVNRDLQQIKDYGYNLEYVVGDDGHKIWSIPAKHRKISVEFTLAELMSLFLGRSMFDFCRGTLLHEALDNVYDKIEKRLKKEKDRLKADKLSLKLYQVSEGPKMLPKRSVDVLDDLLTALVEEWKIRLDYTNAQQERPDKQLKQDITLYPYTLFAHKRGLYMIGYVEQKKQVRVLAIERMSRMQLLKGETFDIPAKFTPEAFFKDAFFIVPGIPEMVELRFNLESEPFIGMRRYHHSQKLTRKGDGIYMKLKVPIDFELINWIASFGPNVKALSPPKLVEEIQNSLERTRALYD